jgi:hypothetical protein
MGARQGTLRSGRRGARQSQHSPREPLTIRASPVGPLARPGRNEWLWTIAAPDGRPITGEFSGRRNEAILAAQQAIERWFERHHRATGGRVAQSNA